MKLPLDNLAYPIKILAGDSQGSGFLVSNESAIYLVTAKHVVYGEGQNNGEFFLYSEKLKILCYSVIDNQIHRIPHIYEIDVPTLSADGNIKLGSESDIAIFKIGTINSGKMEIVSGVIKIQESHGTLVGYNLSETRTFEQVEISNDIFVLGYPSSLSAKEFGHLDYDSPLVRKGIVGGKNQENKTIILDCPVYGGNSGGLVLEVDEAGLGSYKIYLIGVVIKFVPYIDQWVNSRMPGLINTTFHNSGYSVALPADSLHELIVQIESKSKSVS